MKREKRQLLTYKKLIIRTVLMSVFLFISLFSLCFSPKRVLSEDFVYKIAVKHVPLEDENDIAFIRYKAYPTIEKYNNGLKVDIEKAIKNFKEQDRILVAKIPGEKEEIKRFKDYILIVDQSVPELNIELYSAKYVHYKGNSAPVDTFISAARNVSTIANYVYIPLFVILHGTLILTFSIKEYGYIKELKERKQQSR